MDFGLKGKVALMTGASKGIGKAIAEEFAKEGAALVVFLASERASYITKSVYDVDGGFVKSI